MKLSTRDYIIILLITFIGLFVLKKFILMHGNKTMKINNKLDGEKKMVLYYEDWCGHSKRMLPEWEKLEKENTNGVKVEKIKCSENNDICKGEQIRGYPTIKYYNGNGSSEEYNGKRTKKGFLDFLTKNN